MTVSEFENIMRTALRGAEDTECVRDKFIFLLKAMELVEDIADDIALLPASKLNQWEHGIVKRISHSAYCDKSHVLHAVQKRVIEEGKK